MKKFLTIVLVTAVAQLTLGQSIRLKIGDIEFFGTSGLDLSGIRASLPSIVGREVSQTEVNQVKADIKEAISKATGHSPTDVAFTCCDDRGMATIYIGLFNRKASAFAYKPPPNGSISLPKHAVILYDELMRMAVEAVQQNTSEDNSKGYALSSYQPLRVKQLALRQYAVEHEQLLHRMALRSANSTHRAIATEMLGYARRSRSQIRTLVSAGRDANEDVRNNAVRALAVLAYSDAAIAQHIPADAFIDMLNSGTWTDRNKATHLIVVLSKRRDPRLLHQLRVRALPSLIEMARWRDPTHSSDSRIILGRVARLPEEQLLQLVAQGEVERIVSAAQHTR